MQSSTRSALKLALGATDADGAAALDNGGHRVTLRDLEKSDAGFVLYLKKQQPDTYARLFEAEYGKKPGAGAIKAATPMAKAQASQPAKLKLAALGPDVTMRELERNNPALLLELKHHAPDEYSRLFAAAYGKAPIGGPINPAAPATEQAPAVGDTYRSKKPVMLTMMGEPDADQLAQLPPVGVSMADDPRFERID